MPDERSVLVPAAAELDELDGLEELHEDDADATGEHAKPTAASTAAQSSAGRVSAPPPVPKEALEARRPSAGPPRASLPPLPGVSLPPPPPPAGSSIPPPSRSGMFRIDPTHRLPPLPGAAADLPELKRQLSAVATELKESRAHNDRLRLTVRLREDRIRELEQAIADQGQRVADLERDLALVRERKPPDDLKRVAGIGPGFERALHGAGVTSLRQIADWTPDDVERIAPQIKTAARRILRERWIEHARALLSDPKDA